MCEVGPDHTQPFIAACWQMMVKVMDVTGVVKLLNQFTDGDILQKC